MEINLIKKRIGKLAKRLYIQDKELIETEFQPGKHFSYEVDNKNKKIKIIPSDSQKNTVSKRRIKDGIKPVIDIRDTRVMSIFKNSEKLKIEIYEDCILVEGIIAEQATTDSVTNNCMMELKRENKIASFPSSIGEKNKYCVLLKKDSFKKVCGLEGQISTFDFVEESTSSNKSQVIDFKKALNDLKIPLKIVSIYSGAGGLDKGFVDSGFNIEFAIDCEEGAVATYKHNIGDHITHSDILNFNLSKIPKAPIMIGGPSCKKYSQANRRNNITYSVAKYDRLLDHPDNILIKKYIDAIKINTNCKIFVIENVPQMVSVGNEKGGQTITLLDEIIEEMNEFDIYPFILDSAVYGSKQKRKRAIIIGSKLGEITKPTPTHDPSSYITVKEAFAGITEDSFNQKDYTKGKKTTVERYNCIPQGGNWEDISDCLKTPSELKENASKHASYCRRLSWNKCAPTITNVRKCPILHPELNRILTIRESASLFDLPHMFEFKGTLSSMQQQVANMVPLKLSLSIARVIKDTIERYNQKYCVLT